MLIHFGNIIRDSRIPPEFLAFKNTSALIAAVHVYEYIVPSNRDLLLTNVLLCGIPTGAELVNENELTLRRFNGPVANDVHLTEAGPGVAARRFSTRFNAGSGFYIPRETILRGVITFSAGALAKESHFSVVGWLVPAYDLVL
jgi:hypothetical protein